MPETGPIHNEILFHELHDKLRSCHQQQRMTPGEVEQTSTDNKNPINPFRFKVISVIQQSISKPGECNLFYNVKWVDAVKEEESKSTHLGIPIIQTVSSPPGHNIDQLSLTRDHRTSEEYFYDVYLERGVENIIDHGHIANGYLDIEGWRNLIAEDEDEGKEGEDDMNSEDSNAEDYWMNDYPEEDDDDDDLDMENGDYLDGGYELEGVYDELGIRKDGKPDERNENLIRNYEKEIKHHFACPDYSDIEELSTDDEDYVFWGRKLQPTSLSNSYSHRIN